MINFSKSHHIPYWRVNTYALIFPQQENICAYMREPNNEHFASVEALAGRLEMVAKLWAYCCV